MNKTMKALLMSFGVVSLFQVSFAMSFDDFDDIQAPVSPRKPSSDFKAAAETAAREAVKAKYGNLIREVKGVQARVAQIRTARQEAAEAGESSTALVTQSEAKVEALKRQLEQLNTTSRALRDQADLEAAQKKAELAAKQEQEQAAQRLLEEQIAAQEAALDALQGATGTIKKKKGSS